MKRIMLGLVVATIIVTGIVGIASTHNKVCNGDQLTTVIDGEALCLSVEVGGPITVK